MTFQEVLDICNAFIEDSENKEKVEAYNNMLNSLTIRSYLPMQEKVIALVRTVIDSDKDIDVPESMFTAGIEISCLFNGLLSYTNIDKPTNIDVKNYENYDTIYQSGLADYILDFCGKDYERLVRMLERTMSFENLTDLIKSIQAIDLKELRKDQEEVEHDIQKTHQHVQHTGHMHISTASQHATRKEIQLQGRKEKCEYPKVEG